MSKASLVNRFGPITLADQVLPRHVLVFYLAAFFGVCIVTFLNSAQPYLLTELLHIPKQEQGPLAGRLSGFQEVIVILTAGPLGVWSDRLPRRSIYAVGYTILAFGFFCYPLVTSVEWLYLVRFIFAIGISCYAVALASLAVDYPRNSDRGKFLALQVVVTGMAIFLFARPVLGQLASWYAGAGYDPVTTGKMTFWTVSVLCLFNALLTAFLLKPGLATSSEQRVELMPMLKEGFQLAKSQPAIGLSYLTAFATRGDFAVITLFMSLWFTQTTVDTGAGIGDFYARFGAIQVVALAWAPFMGLILDRIDRINGIILAMIIATIAYTSLIMVDDPRGGLMWVSVVLLGFAETSTIMAGNALVGESAPIRQRGVVLGVFTVLGGCGIFAASVFGGMLFAVLPAGPFLFMAAVNLAVMVVALRVKKTMASAAQ
ncbi:MFS transporter [Oceanicoccus sagamiensis]|uniref:Major facilitator superfamily (MFS) profile domain-containing protein n=1 Tax=Oceanicoccus sagamiensis TaxID=716816 RepID=A0A1X9N3K2_9GAMM|nr:MFS transporter [Oceanicoccus sagamiensis]ARN72770.1 hypothetical protein BST96_00760 [Oceanicoccus sagamiensis]